MGNVVLDESGRPACIAHGALEADEAGVFVCATCGAQARFGEPG
jgi:hypothetical protein